MTCQEFVDFVMAYLDAELETSRRAAFEAHIDACPECVTYLDTYRETVRLGKDLLGASGEEPVPDDVPEALIQAILKSRTRR